MLYSCIEKPDGGVRGHFVNSKDLNVNRKSDKKDYKIKGGIKKIEKN